jgi:hypothetical protein
MSSASPATSLAKVSRKAPKTFGAFLHQARFLGPHGEERRAGMRESTSYERERVGARLGS